MTNPPSVPSLDVEACVQLLDDLIVMLAPHDAQSIADANQLRALKLALPGMGKDSERLDTLERFGWVKAGWGLVPQFEWTRKADDGPGGWARLVSPRLRDAIDAARAAQPQETSADA